MGRFVLDGVSTGVYSINGVPGYVDLYSSNGSVSVTPDLANKRVNLTIIPGAVGDASSSAKGVTKLSDDPASPINPIALGVNNANWVALIGGADTNLHKHDTLNAVAGAGTFADDDFLPTTTASFDLGAVGATWKDIYLGSKIYSTGQLDLVPGTPVVFIQGDKTPSAEVGPEIQLENVFNPGVFALRIAHDLLGSRLLFDGSYHRIEFATTSQLKISVNDLYVGPCPGGTQGALTVEDDQSGRIDLYVAHAPASPSEAHLEPNCLMHFGSAAGDIQLEGAFYPDADATRDFGTSAKRWNYLWTRYISGTNITITIPNKDATSSYQFLCEHNSIDQGAGGTTNICPVGWYFKFNTKQTGVGSVVPLPYFAVGNGPDLPFYIGRFLGSDLVAYFGAAWYMASNIIYAPGVSGVFGTLSAWGAAPHYTAAAGATLTIKSAQADNAVQNVIDCTTTQTGANSRLLQLKNNGAIKTGWDKDGNMLILTNKVVGARKTGWSVATGTATRTAFDTATVTLEQLAQRVKALVDDLHSSSGHGLIGT